MQKFEIPKDPRQFLDLIVYIFKASKRVQKALGLAALLFGLMFFSSWLPAELKDFLNQWKVLLIAQISLFVAGLIATEQFDNALALSQLQPGEQFGTYNETKQSDATRTETRLSP